MNRPSQNPAYAGWTAADATLFLAEQTIRLRAQQRGFAPDLIDGTDPLKLLALLEAQADVDRVDTDRTIDQAISNAADRKAEREQAKTARDAQQQGGPK